MYTAGPGILASVAFPNIAGVTPGAPAERQAAVELVGGFDGDNVLVLAILVLDKAGVVAGVEKLSGKELDFEDMRVDDETLFMAAELAMAELLVTLFGMPCTQYLFSVSKKRFPRSHTATYASPRSKLSQSASKS